MSIERGTHRFLLNMAHHPMNNVERRLDEIEVDRKCSRVRKVIVVIPILEEEEQEDITVDDNKSITAVYGIGVSSPCLSAKVKHIVES